MAGFTELGGVVGGLWGLGVGAAEVNLGLLAGGAVADATFAGAMLGITLGGAAGVGAAAAVVGAATLYHYMSPPYLSNCP